MGCDVPEEEFWSRYDRQDPTLREHIGVCEVCRQRYEEERRRREQYVGSLLPPAVFQPRQIGPYTILGDRPLGEGGQAIVYLAEQPRTGRRVALKVLKATCQVERDVRRFEREIRALAALKHESIATLYEASEDDSGRHYFAMELVEGEPLDKFVRAHEPTLKDRLRLFSRICAGVDYAHAHGVIHCDLKPSNVLVDQQGQPKILDFGLAHLIGPDGALTVTVTQEGQLFGTWPYMAPEQARGDREHIQAPCDVYALGVILYGLVTDQPPYELGGSLTKRIATICQTPPRPPSELNPAARGDLERIISKALAKDPRDRYQSVAALDADIRHYLEGAPVSETRGNWFRTAWRSIARHPLRYGLVLMVLVGAAIGYEYRQAHIWRARAALVELARNIELNVSNPRLAEVKEIAAKYPDFPETSLLWIQAQYRAGEFAAVYRADAVRRLNTEARKPGGWAAQLLLAEIRTVERDPNAVSLREAAERAMPPTAEAWYLRSFATLQAAEAQRCIDAALRIDPEFAAAWQRCAYLSFRRGDFDRARVAAARLTSLGEDWCKWAYFEAYVLATAGQYALAEQRVAEVLERCNDQSGALLVRAVVHLCQREYESAVADYTTIFHRVGHDLVLDDWTPYKRATPLWILGRLVDAAADYRHTLRVHGAASLASARLCILLREQARQLRRAGDLTAADAHDDEARVVLERGLQLAGTVPEEPLRMVLSCLAGQTTPEQLVRVAERKGNARRCCEAAYYAGEVALLQGDEEAARVWFRKCVDSGLIFDPESTYADPMNEYHLAVWRLDTLGAADTPTTQAAEIEAPGPR